MAALRFRVLLDKRPDDIDHELAMFHPFLFEAAELQFTAAVNRDVSCAMAYWAEAIGSVNRICGTEMRSQGLYGFLGIC